MRQGGHELTIDTPGQALHEIAAAVVSWVLQTGIETGLLTQFLRRTGAALLIEGAVHFGLPKAGSRSIFCARRCDA